MEALIPDFKTPVFTFYGQLRLSLEASEQAIKLFRAQNPQLAQSLEPHKLALASALLDNDDWSDKSMGRCWANYVGSVVPISLVIPEPESASVLIEFGFKQISPPAYQFLKVVFPTADPSSYLVFVTNLYVWQIHFRDGQSGTSVARGFEFFDGFTPLSASDVLFWTVESEST